MQNNYRHMNDGTTRIEIMDGGDLKEFIIDTEDFEKVSSIPGNWNVWKRSDQKSLPVVGTTSLGKENRYLHRLIVDCPKGKVVYIINRNYLDLRKKNLLLANAGETNSRSFMAKVEQLMEERQLSFLDETEQADSPKVKDESPVAPQPNSRLLQEIKTYVIKNRLGESIALDEDEINALKIELKVI